MVSAPCSDGVRNGSAASARIRRSCRSLATARSGSPSAVNKADDEALARKAVAEVKAALAFERRPWSRPVLAVSATTDLHLEALEKAIAAHYHHLVATGTLESRRAEQAIAWAVGEVVYELGRVGLAALGGTAGVTALWSRQPVTWNDARRLAAVLNRVHCTVQGEK